MKHFFVSLMSGALLFLVGCAGTSLVMDGRPDAEIVIDRDSHPAVLYAAEELQRWVREISGAELPIVNVPGKAKTRIMLKVNPKEFPDDLARLQGNDGYAVRQKGDTIYLFGSCPKGVLNGVYKWLYKNSDIIWARPNTEFGTVFTKNPNLQFDQNDYIDIPVYVLRGWQMIGPRNHVASEEWQVRNGSNWSALNAFSEDRVKYAPVFEFGGGHNLVGVYIPEGKYFGQHPEFYPLINGKRARPGDFNNSVQLCFTNPELLNTFIKEVDERVKSNPNYDTYRIMIEDNENLCECPGCRKPIKLPDGKTVNPQDKNFRSTQFFLWLNEIARHMQKNYPGKRILTFGYFFTEIPPACQVEPNISISFCPIYKNSKEPMTGPANKIWNRQFLGWTKIGANLTWREYFGLVAPFPRPMDIIALEDWRYANRFGINRTYSEMYADAVGPRMDGVRTWDMNSLYFWVMANGSWNPYRNVHEMRREFLHRVYGPAADDVAEFYRIIEDGWFKSPASSQWNDLSRASWRSSVVEPGTTDACRAALDRALTRDVHPNARKMLLSMRSTFEEQIARAKDFSLTVARTGKPPVFDPDFKTGAWSTAVSADNFLTSGSDQEPKEKTAVRLLYDDANLYVCVKCFDKAPGKVFARPAGQKLDLWPMGDKFELCLTGKDHAVYQIVTDVNGNRYDACNKDPSWNGDYRIELKQVPGGWCVLITVPFKTLGLNSAADAKELSAMFSRYWSHGERKTEVSAWEGGSPISSGSYGKLKFN